MAGNDDGIHIDENAQPPPPRRMTMREYYLPTVRRASPIIRPVIPDHAFKPAIIQLIKTMAQFSGLPLEDPQLHINNFLEICDTFRYNGVTSDAARLILFPFSLRDRAKAWLLSLAPGSIDSWEVMKKRFIEKYFPTERLMQMGNEITTLGSASPISRQVIPNHAFKIKPAIIQMICTMVQFSGLPLEDPHLHINNFLEICDTFHCDEVTSDASRLILFPFSLRDRAKAWFLSHSPGSIDSWEVMQKRFLEKYFPTERLMQMRNEIITFRQMDHESFAEAWERFTGLLTKCPKHGIEPWFQVQILYHGMDPSIQALINAAAGGSLMGKTPEESLDLIEEMASNNLQWGTRRHMSRKSAGVLEVDALTALAAQLSLLNKKINNLSLSNAGSDYYSSGLLPPKWHNGGPDPFTKAPPPPGMAWHAPPPPSINNTIRVDFSGPHGPALPPPSPSFSLGFIKSTFSYEQLASATNGFSHENLLGQGGFGYVYKGMLPNGKEIAVKQLKTGSGQGEREFQVEVEMISRVHHRHLVSLVGYCIAGAQRLLIYEFVPNKTLEFHLHGKNQPTMEWPTRMRIALGSAKGLAYLHEDCHPRIIHGDIKTAKILLDNRSEAMVADFGLAKLSSDNYTHVSTRVMGTFGYLAPEYASSSKLTENSDVFSFGVMLLELITGKKPIDRNSLDDSLVDWARPLLTQALAEENYGELVDPRLGGNYCRTEMERMIACAAASVWHSAKRRPTMSQIVRALEGDSSLGDLNKGVKPEQSMLFTSCSDYDLGSYASNMSRLRRTTVFESNDLSQEYSGRTSDYGLNPSA